MVISDAHKYLFLEIPLTASWAIGNELCSHYGGERILHKHATFDEFQRSHVADGDDYLVFATVRHPLDKIVSRFLKLKTDHMGAFSSPEAAQELWTDYSDHEKFDFVSGSDATFQQYFRRYCRRPYGDLIDVSSDRLDFVIRYESLQQGFSKVLHLLGLERIRPIPLINPTAGKVRAWEFYYTSDIVEPAKRVCAPFMEKWSYEFPAAWGPHRPRWIDQVEYRLLGVVRKVYLTRFRYSQSTQATIIRKLRGKLVI